MGVERSESESGGVSVTCGLGPTLRDHDQ
ncbi:hypothetical protein CCACVL1_00196 [Corchorus capsularis]|uniref:Uncharacterized protein n=1 Tax=Corchorus capsularis TaxID=210143 RepID=A0A1R3KY55_COCAP|nr:hypothetical protein CCACVL1_00196 [Corchorus capsularis]